MSSLQKQLAAIASTSSNELDLKAQKSAHSKSLLFEPAMAATQSFDVLYQICIEGFEQLCAVDSRFTRFGKSLFSPQSRSEDRTQMNAKQNAELNAVLESFLSLVGARMLISPAVKAIEWLVRRFRIHEQNTISTILTFLPYHGSQIFQALLSILPKQLPPTVNFLHSYINSLSKPPRSIIVYTCTHNSAFLTALNQYVLNASKNRHQHPALLSLWASVVGQAVNRRITSSKSGRQNVQQQREGDLLLQILPVLNEGLSLKKAPELVLGCYMIIIILTTKAELTEEVLDALLEAVILSWTTDTFDAGLGCAAVVAERKRVPRMPYGVTKAAFKIEDLGAYLARLSKQQSVQGLSLLLVQAVIERPEQSLLLQKVTQMIRQLNYQSVLTDDDLSNLRSLTSTKQTQLQATESQGYPLTALLQVLGPSEDARQDLGENIAMIDSPPENDDDDDAQLTDHISPSISFASLPDEVRDITLLTIEATPLFEQLLEAFVRANHITEHRAAFLGLPMWRSGTQHDPLLLLSFLMRLWCANAPPTARTHAIRLSVTPLESLKHNMVLVVLQTVVPYLMVALSDSTRMVRQAAADLALCLCRASTRESEDHELSEYQGSDWKPYGLDKTGIPPSSASFRIFINNNLQPALEGCIADAGHVRFVFQQAFSKSSSTTIAVEKPLRSSQKVELLTTITHHIRMTPSGNTKLRLLSCCNAIGKIDGQPRSTYMLLSLGYWASCDESMLKICSQGGVSITELDAAFTETVHPSDQKAMDLLLSIAQGTDTSLRSTLQHAAFGRINSLWSAMKPGNRSKMAVDLIDTTMSEGSTPAREIAATESSTLLRKLSLSSDVLVTLLRHATTKLESEEQNDVKRRRTSGGKPTSSNLDQETRKVLTLLSLALELLEAGELAANGSEFHSLFNCLRALQAYRARNNIEVDFLELQAMTRLLAVSKKLDQLPAPTRFESEIGSIDLILNCVRGTKNVQTRNTGLLLLASLAKHMPDRVLKSLVPVFALMSNNNVRQADELSAYVVDQTIQEVMPLLVQALRQQQSDVVSATVGIMSSFAAAYNHIPPVRRMRLFSLLASTLGATESLYAIVSILIDRHPLDTGVIGFGAQMLRHFPAICGLKTIYQYLSLVLGHVKAEDLSGKDILGAVENPDTQKTRVRALLAAAPVLIRAGIPSEKLEQESKADGSLDDLRQCYGSILETILLLSRHFTDETQLRNTCSQVLEQTLKLLPFGEFVKSIEPLINSTTTNMSRNILKAFEVQLRLSKGSKDVDKTAALSLLPRLTSLLSESSDTPIALNAVVCIDQICDMYGKLDVDATSKAAQVIADPRCLRSDNTLLRALSLHCLASMVVTLQSEFIPLLTPALQAAKDSIQQSLAEKAQDIRLHTAAFALMISIADQLSYMISAEALQEQLQLSQSSARASNGKAGDSSRAHFLQVVASRFTLPVIIEASRKSWICAVRAGPRALSEHLSLINTAINRQTKTEIGRQARTILESFTTFFDLRRVIAAEKLSNLYSDTQIDTQQRSTIDALLALVLKISDTVFRPFFVRLVEWTSEVSKQGPEAKMVRQMALFNFLTVLSDRLKSLITPYFTYVLDPLITILTTPPPQPPSSKTAKNNRSSSAQPQPQPQIRYQTPLLLSALSALTSSLHSDTSNFYTTPSRFTTLLPALLTPLAHHPPTPPNSPTRTHLIPAITALATLLTQPPSPDQLALLTTSLLSYLKSPNRRSRMAGVMVMRALTREVGEEWLAGALPVMLPVVAELVEDADEGVVGEAEGWVGEMEGVLGENVGGMLS